MYTYVVSCCGRGWVCGCIDDLIDDLVEEDADDAGGSYDGGGGVAA